MLLELCCLWLEVNELLFMFSIDFLLGLKRLRNFYLFLVKVNLRTSFSLLLTWFGLLSHASHCQKRLLLLVEIRHCLSFLQYWLFKEIDSCEVSHKWLLFIHIYLYQIPFFLVRIPFLPLFHELLKFLKFEYTCLAFQKLACALLSIGEKVLHSLEVAK